MWRSLCLGLVIVFVGATRSASACPAAGACSALTNPIYLQTGDTQLNLMKALGRKLRDNTPKPLTLVYTTAGSCTNIDLMYNRTAPITATMQYSPSIAEDGAWNPASSTTCTCTPPANLFPDIGNSAVFNSACTTETPPATVNLTIGPRQGYVMAMPRGTDQTAITMEEAYFVFGFGPILLAQMNASIAPWTDEGQLFIRTVTKSTLLAWGANISVPGAAFHGTRFDGSPMVVAALQNSTAPANAIGILGSEVYDALRSSLTSLAFRARGQYAAYYPDSTSTSHDKQNVRDGHYTVWSPTIWMDNVDVNGTPINPDARYVIDMIAGHDVTPVPNFEPDVVVSTVGLTPDCAMRVQRSFEGGPLSLYTPPTSCTCKFLATVDTTTCATCDGSTPCATGVCRAGYCEEF